MRNTAAVYLYRALLRECRHQLLERFPGVALNIRATLNSAPGSFNANAAPGLQYQLEVRTTAAVTSAAAAPELDCMAASSAVTESLQGYSCDIIL